LPDRLQSAEHSARLLRVNPDGSRVKLSDVAAMNSGGESYETMLNFNGKPCAAFTIKLASGANALDTITAVRARLAELSPFFPAGVEVKYRWTPRRSCGSPFEDVVKTLVEAIALVFSSCILFLQSFRATLIPTNRRARRLLGTFGVLAAFWFLDHTLTMFGVVLAIGLARGRTPSSSSNVERIMAEQGLSPKEATVRSMGQITGALVGIALVLSAVFVPMRSLADRRVIYRQFSITIVFRDGALGGRGIGSYAGIVRHPCSTDCPAGAGSSCGERGFFGWFNRVFERSSHGYQGIVGKCFSAPDVRSWFTAAWSP